MISSVMDIPRDRNWTLEEVNDEHFKILIPAVVFCVVAMPIGICGNILVLYIFKFKQKPSNHRCFILYLATVDLMYGMFGIPFMIAEMRLKYVFFDAAACKVHRFINYSFGSCSELSVCTIAIHRYLKVCKPNRTQMTKNIVKGLCFVTVLGILSAIPSLVLFGQSSVQTRTQNITGIQCFNQDKYKDTLFPSLYNAFLALCFIVYLVIICICYTLIVRRVKTRKVILEMTSGDPPNTSNQVISTKEDAFNMSRMKLNSTVKTYRVAKMLFLVTAVFIVDHAPYFIVMTAALSDKNFMQNWSTTGEAVFEICRRSYLISTFANPIIYGFMDKKFREECKSLFYRCINRG